MEEKKVEKKNHEVKGKAEYVNESGQIQISDNKRTKQPECQRISIKMDSISENEEFARVVLAVFAARLDPTLEEIDDLKTAVSEAVTNAVIHGYQNGEGIITMDAAINENVLSVTVSDDGIGIPDVEQAMEPMFSTLPEERSGMGFSFMEAFMDQVEVVSAPGKGTSVTMRKKIGR